MVGPDRMTNRSRIVMRLAAQHAHHVKATAIEPEHVLLGLALEESGVAGHVLRSLQGTPELIEAMVPTTAISLDAGIEPAQVPTSLATQRVLARAAVEAELLQHNYIGTEHLLLAAALSGEGNTSKILAQLGLSPETIRCEIYSILGHPV